MDGKKSGSAAKKTKKYVFNDQMQFLNKLYHVRGTIDSLEENPGDNSEVLVEEDVDDPEPPAEDGGRATPFPTVRTPAAKRKHKKQDEFELRLLKVLEPKATCSKMSFLQSLMPHLEKYNENEFLQFQMGVLKVVENINIQKQGLFVPNQNPTVVNHPAPQAPRHKYSSNFFSNINKPGTSNPFQPLPIQHSSYPQEHIGSSGSQISPSSRPPPPNSSPRVPMPTERKKINNDKVESHQQQHQSAQDYYQQFKQETQQSELSCSPAVHGYTYKIWKFSFFR